LSCKYIGIVEPGSAVVLTVWSFSHRILHSYQSHYWPVTPLN